MKVTAKAAWVSLGLAAVAFAAGMVVGTHRLSDGIPKERETPFQRDMDLFCESKLNDSYLSKLSSDEKKGLSTQAFFSPKLHTCVQVEVTSDPKDAGAMNYVVSDLTYGFIAAPKWHRNEQPLHVIRSDYRTYHHLYAEGHWEAVSSDPGQQSVSDANAVKLNCDYDEGKRMGDDSNVCTETEGYTQFGTIQTDTQTYHVASWSRDEVIATSSDRGLTGATTTTLLIHPDANEIEVIDRTKMDEKQPDFSKDTAGKSFGDHFELIGGMYLIDTEGVFFQCDEDGVVIDMRLEIAEKYHGDVVDVPSSEWNAGSKAGRKFTESDCNSALKIKLTELR